MLDLVGCCFAILCSSITGKTVKDTAPASQCESKSKSHDNVASKCTPPVESRQAFRSFSPRASNRAVALAQPSYIETEHSCGSSLKQPAEGESVAQLGTVNMVAQRPDPDSTELLSRRRKAFFLARLQRRTEEPLGIALIGEDSHDTRLDDCQCWDVVWQDTEVAAVRRHVHLLHVHLVKERHGQRSKG
uniref:Secreted protein n=1 Tax=Ixodes ricinus TaxID=34613 RepID=A0A147BWM5_IXORI